MLGASECADLAVIEIDNVATVPYLDRDEAVIRPGLDIYVAGLPLGEPEYTLTRGEYQIWRECGPDGAASLLEVVAEPEDHSFLMLVQVQAVEDRDFAALDRILDTFQLVGP